MDRTKIDDAVASVTAETLAEVLDALARSKEYTDEEVRDTLANVADNAGLDVDDVRRQYERHAAWNAPPAFQRVAGPESAVRPTAYHNVLEVLRLLRWTIAREGWTRRVMIDKADGTGWQPLVRADVVKACTYFEEVPHSAFEPSDRAVDRAIEHAANENAFDVCRDYFEKRLPEWDKTERAATFFERHLGVEGTDLNREFAKRWLLGVVWRGLGNGVKFDTALVPEGAQGLGKSTALAALCPFPSWFCDSVSAKDDGKVVMEKTAGKLIVEIPEFQGARYADLEAFKAVLSTSVDRARLAYAREAVDIPRRFVVAITTNRDGYLQDTTGNRRYWPLRCTRHADLDAVREEVPQIWSEVMTWYRANERPELPKEFWEAAAAVTAARVREGEFDSILEPFRLVAGQVRPHDVYVALGVEGARGSQTIKTKVAESLAALGWVRNASTGDGARFRRIPPGWVETGKAGTFRTPNDEIRNLPYIEVDTAGAGRIKAAPGPLEPWGRLTADGLNDVKPYPVSGGGTGARGAKEARKGLLRLAEEGEAAE
ncbi:MAG: hypothetical protein CTY28_09630 [Hyphomicrobium sp.]|nr:MAG: hypothetical protein CTY28_09630 [Hyphomicrobium sp.]